MKKLKVFSAGIAMLIFFLASANVNPTKQERIITGIVSDQSGPLPGANVVVKGTKRGTTTDIDGKYSITAKAGETLVFSYLGMNDKNITVGNSNVINVQLEAGAQLQAVVVKTAMGVKRQKDAVAPSQQIIRSQEISQKSNLNAIRALAGKVSGLQINSKSNRPVEKESDKKLMVSTSNTVTSITIRGARNLSDKNKALVIIDNKIATAEEFRKLPKKAIVSANVLKGNQAAALYGSEAANGAIVVTTTSSPAIINDEDYDSFVENQFESPKLAALSTFSIDVDNASYTNVRRFINYGQQVPKDAVRVEEMVNFFKYQYPQPKNQHPFSINTEYSGCPWNKNHQLLKIGLQGKIIPTNDLPPSNLVFLIDVSGSMSDENKLPLLQQSMKILVNELRKEDKVSIVVYAGNAGMVLPPTSGSEKQTIIAALDNLSAGGSTAGGAGIQLAYKTATENFIKGGNNRVILATDGDFNVGVSSNSDMETLIEQERKTGVFLTCLGFGMGNYKDSRMELLSDKGNGNYAYIDNIQEANRFLGKEFKGSMFAIAKDVKIKIEFNPKHVQSYRLIGYENRKLRPEDFVNDAIDAGELGSGHTVTALYEIIPTGVKSEYFNETPKLKYTKTEDKGMVFNDELATIKFRYKKPDGDKSTEMVEIIDNKPAALQSASDDFKFSASVAWFGLKLRDSKLISNKSSQDIMALVKQGLSNDGEGYKAEFIRLVDSAKDEKVVTSK